MEFIYRKKTMYLALKPNNIIKFKHYPIFRYYDIFTYNIHHFFEI
jgi:hypothetical protein